MKTVSTVSLTKESLNHYFAHVVMAVEGFAMLFVHPLNDPLGVLVELVHEPLEDVEVEGGSDDLPLVSPHLSCKSE